MNLLPYLIGFIIVLVGLKNVFIQDVSVTVRLWAITSSAQSESDDQRRSAFSCGLAILVGLAQIGVGFGLMLKAPGITH